MLLAVHGMTSSRRSWTRLAHHLDGRFRIAAYDQRGHGDSAGVDGPMSLGRGVRDAENVAAALDEPLDGLVGHSWGGAIAILAGMRLPVRGVAAIDPMIRQVDDDWYEEYVAELRDSFGLHGQVRDARVRVEYADWDPVDVEGKVHAVHAMTVAPIQGLWRENPPEAWDLRESVARYDKPLLLALAASGQSINDDTVLDELRATASANVEIETFADAGHNLHRTHFDRFAGRLDRWLNKNF